MSPPVRWDASGEESPARAVRRPDDPDAELAPPAGKAPRRRSSVPAAAAPATAATLDARSLDLMPGPGHPVTAPKGGKVGPHPPLQAVADTVLEQEAGAKVTGVARGGF